MLVTRNWREQDRIEKEILSAEDVLRETLSRLERLRRQRDSLRARSDASVRRGMQALDEEDGVLPATDLAAMSEEQALVGQAQALGAFGVVDWEAVGTVPYGSAGSESNADPGAFPGLDWLNSPPLLADPDSSGETAGVSRGSGGS